MKKLFTLMLVLLLAIALTGCVLDETDPDNTDPIINTPIYTVAFDSDGGSVVEPLTVEEGDMISRPQIPMKKGYMFVY
jgi:PBP1b-binding outer membrane lipoprotein LpoB